MKHIIYGLNYIVINPNPYPKFIGKRRDRYSTDLEINSAMYKLRLLAKEIYIELAGIPITLVGCGRPGFERWYATGDRVRIAAKELGDEILYNKHYRHAKYSLQLENNGSLIIMRYPLVWLIGTEHILYKYFVSDNY